MDLRNITIDKTAQIEDLRREHLAVCLSSMPGTGKKTAMRILLKKHPEVNPVYCSVEEIEDGSALAKRKNDSVNWFLIRKPYRDQYPESGEGFWRFVRNMPKEDRIFMAVDGVIPESFLEFIWNGIMAAVMPETFWFTEAETWQYLRKCRSHLKYREVYFLTGGWAGCIAMLVRLERQLGERWTVWELCNRYEICRYIRKQILDVLPEEEVRLLKERAAFPFLNGELSALLWGEADEDVEERLFVRGAVVYVPGKESWYVQPALCLATDRYMPPDQCEKAVAWYEAHGRVQDALICCWHRQDRTMYTECVIRNYDKVSFLNYQMPVWAKEENSPECFYIEWMDAFLRQDTEQMQHLRKHMAEIETKIGKAGSDGGDGQRKAVEIYLNAAYTDPEITAREWMKLLEEKTNPAYPIRLYYILGEAVSCLSGLRDLSELFACGKKERGRYRKLWEERLAPENQIPYQLAEMEYDFQIDAEAARGRDLSDLPGISKSTPWPIRLGTMYLAYLFLDGREPKDPLRRFIKEQAEFLGKEDSPVCRWNTKALFYLAEAKWGEKEDLMKWIRETGGEIGNEEGKTEFHLTAEAKVNLYLGNYSRAEGILRVLIPCFKKNRNSRWLAEALFQRALTEYERGATGQAMKTISDSLEEAASYRYVRLYTGYGERGVKLLEEYRKVTGNPEAIHDKEKKYKYGSVLNMSEEEWVDYIFRKAYRRKKYYPDFAKEQENIFRVEKLTVTELMVLRYMEEGYSNAAISEKMNVRLTTVKSHIYSIYRKLGVTTRIQAVRRAYETGMLQE